MYAGKDWDNIEAGETDVFTIEFTQDLQNGRTISSPVFTCTVVQTDTGATVDPTPSARISGGATISTLQNPVNGSLRTFANQKITGMIVGNKYALEATVSTSDGCTLRRYSRVYCTPVV